MTITVRTGFDKTKQVEIYETVKLTAKQAQVFIQEQATRWPYEKAKGFSDVYGSKRLPAVVKKKYKKCTKRR